MKPRRISKREKQIDAVKRLLELMEPYAKVNPKITVREVLKLEEQRILDGLEKDLTR